MSIELRPYTEFDSAQLAAQLHEAVVSSESLLRQRNINGPIARYGGELALGIQNVEKGQEEHYYNELGHFAIIGDSGDVVGAGSIYPDLKLRKLRLPLPTALATKHLLVKYPYAAPNIHAWVNDEQGDLTEVYTDLLEASKATQYCTDIVRVKGDFTDGKRPGIAWTLEPRRSPKFVHDSIQASRLKKVATRRFDDGESKRRIPPRGTVYAAIKGTWLSSHGAQHELLTGENQSFWDEAHNEMVSRDPRGFGHK